MSALWIDCEEIETLVYERLDGRERGWRVELLVEQLTSKLEEKFLLCSYCRGLMRDACLLEMEGKQELRCYVCIPEGTKCQRAEIYQEAINEKLIQCPLRERGCVWRDTVSRGIQHVEECEFLLVLCPLKCVESGGERSGEVVRVERRLMAEHEREYCPQREQRCEFCGRGVRACEMNPHLEECSGFPVDCPNGCEVAGETGVRQMKREDVPLHLAECPLRTVKCPYWNYGCGEEMQRGQLDLHEREAMHTHLRLATTDMYLKLELKQTKTNELKSQLLQANEKIRSLKYANVSKGFMIDLLRKNLSKLRESVAMVVPSGRLEWKIGGVKQRIEKKEVTLSDPFYVGLYQCQLRIEWAFSYTRLVACSFSIMQGEFDCKLEWPFLYRYKFALFNQTSEVHDYIGTKLIPDSLWVHHSHCFQRPTEAQSRDFGTRSFIPHADILTEKYCRDDTISLHIIVEQLPPL